MAGNPHPVFQDGVPVDKGLARIYLPLRLGNPDALLALDGSTFWLCYIQTLLAFFYRDPSDTTTAVNGKTVLRDANGALWKIVSSGAGIAIGAAGPVADRDAFDGEDPGFTYFGTDTELLYVRLSEGGWSDGSNTRGPEGPASTVPGPPNELAIGTVNEGPVDASITGSYPDQKLNLTLQKGNDGAPGPAFKPDEIVPNLAGRAAYDGEVKNFAVLVEVDSSNSNEPTMYFKLSAASGDWSSGYTFTGGGGSGDVVGPSSSGDAHIVLFDGVTGKAIKDSGKTLDEITGNVAGETHAAVSKTTPDDADELPLIDSGASFALKKLTWANLKATLASWLVSAGWIREALSANRTYYVDTTNGNDSNSGLAAGSGNAFKTIQKAYDVIASKLDLAGYTVTIQIADGTYAPTSGTNALLISKPWTGGGSIVVQGNSSTPANVVLSTTSANVVLVTAPLPGILTLKDFKLQTATSGGGILLQAAGAIQFGNLNFGTCVSAHYGTGAAGAFIKAISNYSITGGAGLHALATNPSSIIASGVTITLTGTPAFTTFAQASSCSVMDWSGTSFSGGATGARYAVLINGVLYTGGAGPYFFPGSTDGITASGGQYL